MKLPRLFITTFAKKCCQKVVYIEEYMASHQKMTVMVQLERLEIMNSILEAQWQRMQTAFYNHNPMIDTVDKECLLELADVVTWTAAEVEEILRISRQFANTQLTQLTSRSLADRWRTMVTGAEKTSPWGNDAQVGRRHADEKVTQSGSTMELQDDKHSPREIQGVTRAKKKYEVPGDFTRDEDRKERFPDENLAAGDLLQAKMILTTSRFRKLAPTTLGAREIKVHADEARPLGGVNTQQVALPNKTKPNEAGMVGQPQEDNNNK